MKTLQHSFVEYIPEVIEQGMLYISVDYHTAVHKCVCGCGNEVVTPISPTDWQLTFNGETVTLYPSIGNWAFKCRSHYWIRNNKVIVCESWSDKEIESGRSYNKKKKRQFYSRWKKGKK